MSGRGLNIILATIATIVMLLPLLAWPLDNCEKFQPNLPFPPSKYDLAALKEYHYEEIIHARRAGVDLIPTLLAATRKDKKALSKLFGSVHSYDGAAAEEFAYTMYCLMYGLGDDFFSSVLIKEKPEIRQRVIDQVDFAAGSTEYSQFFPKTYKLGEHRRY